MGKPIGDSVFIYRDTYTLDAWLLPTSQMFHTRGNEKRREDNVLDVHPGLHTDLNPRHHTYPPPPILEGRFFFG